MDKHVTVLASKYGISPAPITPQLFGAAGKEHMEKYGQSGQSELRTISIEHIHYFTFLIYNTNSSNIQYSQYLLLLLLQGPLPTILLRLL